MEGSAPETALVSSASVKKRKKPDAPPLYTVQPKHRFRMGDDFIRGYMGKEPAWGPVGKIAYVRTYARELRGEELVEHLMRDFGMDRRQAREDARRIKVRREEFWQTARRVVEFVQTVFKQTALIGHHPWDEAEAQEKAQEMYRLLWAFKWLPPGRGLQFAGTPVLEKKGGACMNNCGFKSTRNIDKDFADAFCTIMDFLMLGVGMGSDVRGAGKVVIKEPYYTDGVTPAFVYEVEDTREGWVEAVRIKLNAYVGRGPMPKAYDTSKIRREGLPLKTFGGTASGPGPLIRLLDAIDAILQPLIGLPITATAIADIINHIGCCVVAGNIRRSAEILIGQHGNEEFAGLKDPTLLRQYEEGKKARVAAIPEAARLDKLIRRYKKNQTGHSAASEVFLKNQDLIDRTDRRLKKLLAKDAEWARLDGLVWAHPLNTHRWASNNTVLCERSAEFFDIEARIVTNGEPGVAFMDNIRAYGRMNGDTSILPPKEDWLDAGVEGFNPCAEQPLEDDELCCLGELNPNAHANVSEFLHTIKFAYMYCKAVTLIPTNRPATNRVMTKNRRIGLSLMGVFKMYERLGLQECIRWWNLGYEEVRKWDRTYSRWLGCNESIKVTSLKPGGTVPLLPGEEGGMKVLTSRYYFRTIRADYRSPLVKACKDAGYRVEKDRTSARTMVIYFPVAGDTDTRTAEQVPMLEQMQILAALQGYWSDNMVSNTITFQPPEAPHIARAVAAHAHKVKAISFLPLTLHGYPQAPYIPISKEEYDYAVSRLGPLDLSATGHEVDEKFCTGEACSIA